MFNDLSFSVANEVEFPLEMVLILTEDERGEKKKEFL